MAEPQTALHFAPNANLVNGVYTPGGVGFNLADVTPSDVNSVPAGVKGLVWLGDTIGGATTSFQATINSLIGNPNVYGFYLADEPGPGYAANLKAESDYIHAHDPGAKTFIVLENNGSDASPQFSYNPANTDIDLFGLDPYPIQTGGVNYSSINTAVAAAEAQGIPQSQIVPVYQAFGGISPWVTPTAAQEQTILATWGSLIPAPAFDYAYSWGVQGGDTALATNPTLQLVLAAHNAGTSSTAGTLAGKVQLSSATEATMLSGTTTIATFTDTNPADTAGGFAATINWGDGTTSAGSISGANGSFSVLGGHTYADEGNFAVSTTITRTADKTSISPAGTVVAAEADVLTPQAATFTATAGQALANVTVASFTDTGQAATAGDFTATINWGDGTGTTGGAVAADGSGMLTVSGTHTYVTPGTDTVTVTLADDALGTATATASSTATVAAGALSGATVIGSGPDEVVLEMSEDAWNGNAQFTVSVDGTQIGGVQTATASHALGQSQEFDVLGSFGAAQHTVTVNFLNDANGGTAATDRNLYVNSASYGGVTVSGSLALYSGGPQSLVVGTALPATTVTVGSGPDTLDLKVSEDAWNGDAEFAASVDGTQIGGTVTAQASHAAGQVQDILIKGSFGPGQHTATVTFLNDAYGGTSVTDRNLYVTGATIDGQAIGGSSLTFWSDGSQSFAFQGSTTVATSVISARLAAPGAGTSGMSFIGGSVVDQGTGNAVASTGPSSNSSQSDPFTAAATTVLAGQGSTSLIAADMATGGINDSYGASLPQTDIATTGANMVSSLPYLSTGATTDFAGMTNPFG